MAFVRDIMKKEVIVAKADDSIRQVSKILTEKKISNMPVINKKEEILGIISEKDIIRAMECDDCMKKTAKNVMTTEILSVKEGDPVEYVSKIFIEGPYRRLPVTRNKRVIGVVTRESIIKSFMKDYY